MNDAIGDDLRCPNCGHMLSMWRPPAPARGEMAAMRVADTVAS